MNANRFESKIILVTGGNSEIGLATARRLATEGATVIISGRNRETLDRAMQHLGERAQGIKVDMTKALYAQVKKKFGRLDGLFANAGIGITEPIENVSEQSLDAMLSTNIKGTFFTLQSDPTSVSRICGRHHRLRFGYERLASLCRVCARQRRPSVQWPGLFPARSSNAVFA
jgi:NAD(P)-dependent dehydrogenase (short-subunit alcohol dehydrogenase family)